MDIYQLSGAEIRCAHEITVKLLTVVVFTALNNVTFLVISIQSQVTAAVRETLETLLPYKEAHKQRLGNNSLDGKI
jgi:hypothetical protein